MPSHHHHHHPQTESYNAWLDRLCRERYGTSVSALRLRNSELEARHAYDKDKNNRLEGKVRRLQAELKVLEKWYAIVSEKLARERKWKGA